MMKCTDCPYYWEEPGDAYPSCKWDQPGWWPAPCEEEVEHFSDDPRIWEEE